MATVTPTTSPADLLAQLRGMVFDAAPGYPDVIHLQVRDAAGREWWFATFYAEYSPSDPEVFLGRTVVSADLSPDERLTIGFSDGTELNVIPIPQEKNGVDDDLETWHLHTPDGLSLGYGPEGRWSLKRTASPS